MSKLNVWYANPLPPVGSMDWQSSAVCQWADPSLFTELTKKPGASDRARLREAFGVCAECPVRLDCLEFGVRNAESGVYGGCYLSRGKWLPVLARKG